MKAASRLTSFEAVLMFLFLFLFLKLGQVLSHRWGTIGWLIAVPPIIILAILLFSVFCSIAVELTWSLRSRPACSRGSCTRWSYVLVECTTGWAKFRCACGDLYLAQSRSFMRLSSDGKETPYMVREESGNWARVEPPVD